MESQQQNFDVSGLQQLLSSFDWRNTFHRASIAASLVQGVYILEEDRQSGSSSIGHASPWWERFNFQLNKVLVDDKDFSYFGAIYEFKYPHDPSFYQSTPHPPRYVIAFRGTNLNTPTMHEDMKLNFKSIFDKPQDSLRFHKALEAVTNTVNMAGAANVWLAGHSLGAIIAMHTGRSMAKSRLQLETYLFNPPFISVPIEKMIENETLQHDVRIVSSFLKAGIATAFKLLSEDPKDDLFDVLSEWSPYLFVNRWDPICAGYIRYFQHRDEMDRIGVGKIERIATQCSFGSLVSGAIGKDSEPFHLLPTAYLTVNDSSPEDPFQAHGIRQWFQPHFQWQLMLYKFK